MVAKRRLPPPRHVPITSTPALDMRKAHRPDPAAPEFAAEVKAHLGWWRQCWDSMHARDLPRITMNPEFGVDRYLQLLPYTQQPVADLPTIHHWMAKLLRNAYAEWADSLAG